MACSRRRYAGAEPRGIKWKAVSTNGPASWRAMRSAVTIDASASRSGSSSGADCARALRLDLPEHIFRPRIFPCFRLAVPERIRRRGGTAEQPERHLLALIDQTQRRPQIRRPGAQQVAQRAVAVEERAEPDRQHCGHAPRAIRRTVASCLRRAPTVGAGASSRSATIAATAVPLTERSLAPRPPESASDGTGRLTIA